ncbi:MAG TPA: hypothetical protein RMI62_32955 [Polyangiaceae bacterium LLY-WYZ-15_(1-7)]|nr:hypothetical protein [Polyangiaceae bacterium LLY-WYZ-15_(1-7)]
MTDLSPPRSTPPLGARRPTPAAGLARQLAAARERVWVARPEAERAFAALLSGEGPPALFFAGSGGLGKSTLLARLRREAEARGERTAAHDLSRIPADPATVTALFDGLRAGSPGCVFLDGFEHHAGLERHYWETWLPSLPDGTRVVLAGRLRPRAALLRASGWQPLLRVHVLDRLDPERAAELLRHLGVDEAAIPARVTASAGHPLTLARLGEVEVLPSGEVTDAWLTESLIGALETPRERALVALAMADGCDRALLAAFLEQGDARAMEAWLRQRPYVRLTPQGWALHELYADPLLRQARRAAPETYRRMIRVAGDHLADRLALETAPEARLEILRRAFSMARLQPPTAEMLPDVAAREFYWDAFAEPDRAPMLRAVEAHEGPTSAAICAHHLAAEPSRARVLRDGDGALRGFLVLLDRAGLDRADVARDPAAAFLDDATPPGRDGILVRHWMALETHQAPSPVASQVLRAFVGAAYARPGLARHFVLEPDRDGAAGQFWVEQGLLDVVRDPAFEEDGRRTRVVGWDLVAEPIAERLRHTVRLHLGEARGEEAPALAEAAVADPEERVAAVEEALQKALRRFHDDEALARGALAERLAGPLGLGELGVLEAAERVRAHLREAAAALPATAKVAAPGALLEASYFTSPVPKQLTIAADMGMSYSSFRRHLADARRALALRLATAVPLAGAR